MSETDRLARFGGKPAFAERLHVGRPNIGERERLLARINDILDRRMLTNGGPYVRELEQRIAAELGVRHCIATCNATVGLEMAIRALGLQGEVIVPSLTFIATANALQWQQITPVFCDVDPETHNLDPEAVELMITPRTTGIIGVHLWGRPCEVERLTAIAQRHNLKLMFDAAHAFGCSCQGRMIGGFGAAEVLSFHAAKFLNTLEGGAVVTNDDDLSASLRLIQNHGFREYDNVVCVGTNGKMNEVSAAMGLTSLESLERFIAVNRRNYHQYLRNLEAAPGLQPVLYDEKEKCNFQYVVLEIDERLTAVSRDQLVEVLWAEGVLARRYFHPGCHRMEPYRSMWPQAGLLLPHTERLTPRLLSLPTGTAVSEADINIICDILRFSIEHGAEVRERLNEAKESAVGFGHHSYV
jgi:dTDP-4-amino-4,6-dideoxygalactose transaminase